MAKTIKFNLICDGNSVRTIEDLQNNYSIEDMLAYFKNNLLHKWLEVRGYSQELDMVKNIKDITSMEITKQLIKIFNIEKDETSIEESVYILEYKEENEFLLSEYKKYNYKKQDIIEDYHAGYRKLIDTIIENKTDIAKIKAAIKEIDKNYKSLFDLDYRNLFYTLLEKAPMALFAMLMRDEMRKKYLPIIYQDESGKEISDLTSNSDKMHLFNSLCKLTTIEKLKEILGDTLKSFAGQTAGYWHDVESSGKRYMILRMEKGNFVREMGKKDGDLNSDDINNKFVILNGIDYKSNNESHQLLYMEV